MLKSFASTYEKSRSPFGSITIRGPKLFEMTCPVAEIQSYSGRGRLYARGGQGRTKGSPSVIVNVMAVVGERNTPETEK